MRKIYFATCIAFGLLKSLFAQNIYPSNGNVGFGTTAPLTQLSLIGPDPAGGMINVRNTTPGQYSGINMITENGDLAASCQYGNANGGGLSNIFFIGNRTLGPMQIVAGPDAHAVLTVLNQGNIGIGNINPQNKLDVNGTVHSKQVNVDMSGWSDNVFETAYNLTPLSDVKKYIDRNHHLSEIPSEKEIVSEGLDLGNINRILTKKVEELTLYLLEMHTQMQELKSQVKNLKEERQKLVK